MLDWLGERLFNTSARRLYGELGKSKPLYLLRPGYAKVSRVTVRAALQTPSPANPFQGAAWHDAMVMIDEAGVSLFPYEPELLPPIPIPRGALRWFGRPQKYDYGRNTIWLHSEQEGGWQIVSIDTFYTDLQRFVRAIKQIATPEQVKAYRRRRPYIHHGASVVQPATQDLHGAWALSPPVVLYVMPLFVVILAMDGAVLRTLPLPEVRFIEAVRRLDAPGGLVRFKYAEESYAFEARDYRELAQAIADAAKRSLEEPVERKRKGWDEDDDE
jgi:hypothetical protein